MTATSPEAATGAAPPAQAAWHALPVEDVLRRLDSRPEGLSAAEAARRLAAYGPNRLPEVRRAGPLQRFLAQFDNLLIYVLLVAAAITFILGHTDDTAVILAVVVLNAIIGFIQEGRAERALDAIRAMLTPHASVIRDGQRSTIGAADLVVGDIVLLEAGDRVPADIRFVQSRSVRMQEAILTGESVPVEKAVTPVAPHAPLGERAGMAFSGTLVVAGRGTGAVVATGSATELGRISMLVGSVEKQTTPLLHQMDRFARWLTAIILVIAAAVFAFAVLVQGFGAEETFLALVGVAVAAIPEGLPAVLTITMAIGVQRMAGRQAIIRRLPVVETLGCVSVICTDKTGTLTRNEMTVRAVVTATERFEVGGVGYEPRGTFRRDGTEADPAKQPSLQELARGALLSNDARLRQGEDGWAVDGDPMEGALVALAIKAGHDPAALSRQLPRRDEIPFDAEHRFMATLHHGPDGAAFAYVKGAPERVLAMCDRQRIGQGEKPIDPAYWQHEVEALAGHGQRVLAIAVKPMPLGARELSFAAVDRGLVLLGLVGLIDPPREEAIAAVRDCRAAGIRVKMITGDHAVTAGAIARQLGLENPDRVASGHTLDALDATALRALARDTDVFARTSPEHKLRLVEALQADGAVVAMTGDGVNDAPALKRADVGIAMGQKGTEAAKEASGMVLADDNFASIAAAVRQGRTVYDNLKKEIVWTLPADAGEAFSIIIALLLGLTLPITAMQILWINMVTAVALGLTLAFEPTEPDTMRRPPRRLGEPLLSRFLAWRVIFVSALFVGGAFGMFSWALHRGLPVEEGRTIVVNTIVVLEIFYLFSVRQLRSTGFTWRGLLGTRAVVIGVAATAALQFAFTYLPFMNGWFETRPLGLLDGAVIVAVGVVLLLVLEAEKLVRRRLQRPAGDVSSARP